MIDESTTTQDASEPFEWPKFLANSIFGWLFTWLGIALAGAMFGTCIFPIAGTIVGFIVAGMSGGVTSLMGICLHVAMRGRLPLRVSANFAGAAAGFTSWGAIGDGDAANPTRDMLGFQVITTQLGSLGAVIATAIVLRILGRTRLGEAARPTRFSIKDLLIFTAWLAMVLTAYRIWMGPIAIQDNGELYISAIVLGAMLMTESFCWVYRRLLVRPKREADSGLASAEA